MLKLFSSLLTKIVPVLLIVVSMPALTEQGAQTLPGANPAINLGEPMSEAEIAPYAITIFPDGRNLPAGQGSVAQGAALYHAQCEVCHGESGIEGPAARLAGSDGWFSFSDPLRALRIKKYPILLISVGSLWPHVTSIFDYVRRAMPHYAPKSLHNDEVYALTAYILHLNNLLDAQSNLNQVNILHVSMPGKERSVSAWQDK